MGVAADLLVVLELALPGRRLALLVFDGAPRRSERDLVKEVAADEVGVDGKDAMGESVPRRSERDLVKEDAKGEVGVDGKDGMGEVVVELLTACLDLERV